ncbi:group II intron maturase-specific domain-containing protein [Kribbella sp. CA-245084]|uniref:group II intron maturase-specific domain-containing protein n=1 Tax=Kribbella sp. CA-245084 TaxID=3239940 RepID=UPI003D94A9AD
MLRRLNPVLRGWCAYFRHCVSSRTLGYIDHFAFGRIVGWLRKRHVGLNIHTRVQRFLPDWQIRVRRSSCSGQRPRRSSVIATGALASPHHGERTDLDRRSSGIST